MYNIEYLDWDSELFAIKVGRVLLNEKISAEVELGIIDDAKRQSYKLLYIFSIDSLAECNSNSFFLADKKVELTKNIRSITCLQSSVRSFDVSCDLIEDLYHLALESGKYSRFRLDKNMPVGTFEKMYRIWIERSTKKEIASDVLVYIYQEQIRGMLTYKINEGIASIGLIGVSSVEQNRGIGSCLVEKLESVLNSNAICTLNVATQADNLNACSFYCKNGFSVSKITYIYHLWL